MFRFITKYFCILLLIVPIKSFSQEKDTISDAHQKVLVDKNSVVIQDTVPTANHNPKLAAGLSAILPGLGQAYNKKYWKIPIIYVGFAAFGYFINYNDNYYKTFKKAYITKTDGDTLTNSKYSNFSTDQLMELTKSFRRTRDLLVIGTVAFYLLNIVDATVDAHLYSFDVSDDLSLRFQPSIQYAGNAKYTGFSLSLNF